MWVVWHGAAAGLTVLQQVRRAGLASRVSGGVQAGDGVVRRCCSFDGHRGGGRGGAAARDHRGATRDTVPGLAARRSIRAQHARISSVIVWHLLANPAPRFRDLGADFHSNRIATERRLRNHIAQLTAMGYQVTIEPAA